MIMFPNAVQAKLKDVAAGSLVLIRVAETVTPAVKGLGQENGDDVHVVFLLKPVPGVHDKPALRTPREDERVLNFGHDWALELPIDTTGMRFDGVPSPSRDCGVAIVADTKFLRVCFERPERASVVFLNLSTGESLFTLPDAPEVFVPGWTVRILHPEILGGGLSESIFASWSESRPDA